MESFDFEQPLFVVPDETHERYDEWSEPKGFLLGGWGPDTRLQYAQQYFDAANTLADAILENKMPDYMLALPALYLYRHWLELVLKEAVNQESPGHDIGKLAKKLEAIVKARYGGDALPAWVIARLLEIAEFDPDSITFRYPERLRKDETSPSIKGGELHVNLRYLMQVMNVLNSGLSRVLHESPPIPPR